MSVLRGLRRTAGFLLRTAGGLWSLLMLLLMAGSLALSVAMTVVPAIFSAAAGVVESVTGVRSVASRQADDIARLERRADNLARELTDSRAAQSRMARELADSRVTYRGTRMAARDAVKDTATRVSRRTAFATSRNVASMAGEALPVIGVGVIVAATAWELTDACALMGEMRALDAAFNPDDPVTDDEICGMKVPTRDELWAGIKSSPAAAWDSAAELYEGLPEVSVSAAYGRTIGFLSGLWDMSFGKESDTAEGATP